VKDLLISQILLYRTVFSGRKALAIQLFIYIQDVCKIKLWWNIWSENNME